MKFLSLSLILLFSFTIAPSDSEKGARRSEPLEQLVVHHQGPLFKKRISGKIDVTSKEKLLEEWFGDQLEAAKALEVKALVNSAQNNVDIVVVDDSPETAFYVDASLEQIKARFCDFGFRLSQYKVCIELLKGRHHSSPGIVRHDVFFSAPCGFGKSLCFAVATCALGGITVSFIHCHAYLLSLLTVF
jgi:hypothetical protein